MWITLSSFVGIDVQFGTQGAFIMLKVGIRFKVNHDKSEIVSIQPMENVPSPA